jgi:hypothetical protein
MADTPPDRLALAVGLATSTLDDAERAEAEALVTSDPAFAALVADCRQRLDQPEADDVSDGLWRRIERRLTDKNH